MPCSPQPTLEVDWRARPPFPLAPSGLTPLYSPLITMKSLELNSSIWGTTSTRRRYNTNFCQTYLQKSKKSETHVPRVKSQDIFKCTHSFQTHILLACRYFPVQCIFRCERWLLCPIFRVMCFKNEIKCDIFILCGYPKMDKRHEESKMYVPQFFYCYICILFYLVSRVSAHLLFNNNINSQRMQKELRESSNCILILW